MNSNAPDSDFSWLGLALLVMVELSCGAIAWAFGLLSTAAKGLLVFAFENFLVVFVIVMALGSGSQASEEEYEYDNDPDDDRDESEYFHRRPE